MPTASPGHLPPTSSSDMNVALRRIANRLHNVHNNPLVRFLCRDARTGEQETGECRWSVDRDSAAPFAVSAAGPRIGRANRVGGHSVVRRRPQVRAALRLGDKDTASGSRCDQRWRGAIAASREVVAGRRRMARRILTGLRNGPWAAPGPLETYSATFKDGTLYLKDMKFLRDPDLDDTMSRFLADVKRRPDDQVPPGQL